MKTIKELIEEYDEAMVDDKGPRGSYDDIMEALKEAAQIIGENISALEIAGDALRYDPEISSKEWLKKWGFE